MRVIFSMLFLMLSMAMYSQDTEPTTAADQEMQTTQLNSSDQKNPSSYTLGNDEFKFIPEDLGYRVSKIENGKEVDYGHLRLTTDDGYYVLTSMVNDHVSYGRFDDAGNFNAMRYDEKTDMVVEEKFTIASTK